MLRPTLINDAGFNYSQSAINSTPAGLECPRRRARTSTRPSRSRIPRAWFPNSRFTSGSSLLGYGPYNEYNKNFAWFDNLNWIKGRHNLALRFLHESLQQDRERGQPGRHVRLLEHGRTYWHQRFQQSWANFLLGNVATFSMPSMDITPDLWTWQHEAYAQDDFKVTPHLTLFMGVRWSFFGQPTRFARHPGQLRSRPICRGQRAQDRPDNRQLSYAGTGTNPSTNGIIVGGKSSPFGDKIAPNKYTNFAPRLGLAWDPFGSGKTAIRAGYGIYYDSTLFGGYEQNIFANPPFVQTVTYSNANFSNVAAGTLGVSASPLVLHATQLPAQCPLHAAVELRHSAPVTRQHDLRRGLCGHQGHASAGLRGYQPGGSRRGACSRVCTPPTARTIFTTADDPRINAVRPYLGFNAINTIESAFDSNYNSLQVDVRKRHSARGGVLAFAYTYSKMLTDNSSDRSNAPQNSYNWHEGEYGPASFDRKQIMTLELRLSAAVPARPWHGRSHRGRMAVLRHRFGFHRAAFHSDHFERRFGRPRSARIERGQRAAGYGLRPECQRAAPIQRHRGHAAVRSGSTRRASSRVRRRGASGQCRPLHRSRTGLLQLGRGSHEGIRASRRAAGCACSFAAKATTT